MELRRALLAAVLLGGCASPIPPPPAEPPLVAFLGDSICGGLFLDRECAFPAVLRQEMEAEGRPIRVLNAGVPGDTTAGGRARLAGILRRKPAVVVVELGANDAFRGVPVATMEANLREILDRVKEAGARPLLIGIRVITKSGPDYEREFAGLYARLAEATGTPLLDDFLLGVAGVRTLNLPDGIHPNAEGHRILAAAIRESLDRLLR